MNRDKLTPKELRHLDMTLAFLGSIGIKPKRDSFYVEIHFDSKGEPSNVFSSATDTVFRLAIYNDEWNVLVCKPNKVSHVRVGPDGPFVHGSDVLGLVKRTPQLTEIADFFHDMETLLRVKFPRVAFVRTNIAGGKKAVEKWVATL